MSGRFGRHGGSDRRERGAVLLLTAIALPVLLLATSFAVDLGRQRAARRDMQGKSEVIALDLARLMDGVTPYNSISYSSALAASAARNGIAVAKITSVAWGTTNATTNKFEACATASCVPSAVKVTAEDNVKRLFQVGSSHVARSAVAGRDNTAIGSFSIGSSLARLSVGDSAALNPLLGGLLGSSLNLTALDYQGLAGANVSIADLVAASPGAGSVDSLLNTPMSIGQFRDLTAQALTNKGQLVQANLIRNLPLAIPTPQQVKVGDMVNLQSQGQSALDAGINVIDLLITGAQLANGSNFINLNLGIPGLASAKVKVTEPPLIAIGPAKQVNGQWVTQAHSANLRLELLVEPSLLNLNLSLPAGLATIKLNTLSVPLVLNGGGASGALTKIDCAPNPDVLDVLTTPKPLSAVVSQATIASLSVRALLGLINIPVSVTANMTGPASGTEYGNTTVHVPVGGSQSTSARSLQLGNILTVSDLNVQAAGLDLSILNGIAGALLGALNPILNGVSTALNPVLELLGAKVGTTDVGGLSAKCEGTGVRLIG